MPEVTHTRVDRQNQGSAGFSVALADTMGTSSLTPASDRLLDLGPSFVPIQLEVHLVHHSHAMSELLFHLLLAQQYVR